jgi:hypothetical protein
MRKYALLIMAALLLAAGTLLPAFAGNPSLIGTSTIDNPTDNQTGSALALPKNISKVVLYIPTMTSSAVSLKVSSDSGTTYDDLFCFNNGTNTILWATAADTGGQYVEVPCDMYPYTHMKVYAGSAQGADRAIIVYGVPQLVFDPTR